MTHVAQADQFIRPRITPADDDPDYGKLLCGAPLIDGISGGGATTPPGRSGRTGKPAPDPRSPNLRQAD